MHQSDTFLNFCEADRRRVLRMLVAVAATAFVADGALADDLAAHWPKNAFEEKGRDKVLDTLYGKTASISDDITLVLPEIAENGAVVPIEIKTTLPSVTSVSILIPDNPSTLICSYTIPDGTLPDISSRIKMAKTGPVIGVVESGGKLLMATKTVKVTLGGCG